MVPHTYPSQLNSLTGRREMIVYKLSSVSGLQRWVDYIPIKFTDGNFPVEGETGQNGFIAISQISSITGLIPYKDYVPVYVDPAATDVWYVNSLGYIPVEHSGRSTDRYIRTFNGVNQYGTLNTPVTFTGDFEIEFEATTITTGTTVAVSAGGTKWAGTYATGNVGMFIDAFVNGPPQGGVTPADGKIHLWKVARVGNTSTLYIDEVIQLTSTAAATSLSFDTIGMLGAAFFWLGAIPSVKFTDNSVSPGAITNYVIDNASTTTTYARGHVSPSAYYITWTNITASDIQLATYNQALRRWESTTTADVWEYA